MWGRKRRVEKVFFDYFRSPESVNDSNTLAAPAARDEIESVEYARFRKRQASVVSFSGCRAEFADLVRRSRAHGGLRPNQRPDFTNSSYT
jgi:hypothetical protein